jgi:pilus assembly protein CpaF
MPGIVVDEVRELIRRSGIDPARDTLAVRGLVEIAVADYDDRSADVALPPLPDVPSAVKRVLDDVAGYGPLQPYLDDPSVEEVCINEPGKVFVARGGVSELTTTILTEDDFRSLVERMLKSSGRRVDLSSPFVDSTLPDGSRLHVVIPDITFRHWAVNVRKFVLRAHRLDDLVGLGTLTTQAAASLEAAVASGLNVLVSGGTQAGKTTMLNCLAAAIPARERVVTCEEVFELMQQRGDTIEYRPQPCRGTDRGAGHGRGRLGQGRPCGLRGR